MIDYLKILKDIKEQYLEDDTPWVIGFSGGKDSTITLQMIFYAICEIPQNKRTKEIHVLSNDTLVENPVIIKELDSQLRAIKKAGRERLYAHNPKLFNVVKTKPKIKDTFWVNLIGNGYPSPNRWFRWCTQRMKINPTKDYILSFAEEKQKAILILGTRKAESVNRAKSLAHYNSGTRLKKYSLRNVFVFTPIADMTNDDVWIYLNQVENPWGYDNKRLISMYKNATGECPLVIETGSASCGNSRFGCWTCTVVKKDQSLQNQIDNGYDWMTQLLEFRNYLADIRLQDNHFVDGRLEEKVKFGPFLLKTRKQLLKQLIEIGKKLDYEVITKEELSQIEDILYNKHKQERLKKYVLKLADGRKVTFISDFNPLKSTRKRFATMSLKDARLIKTEIVSKRYSEATRVIYY